MQTDPQSGLGRDGPAGTNTGFGFLSGYESEVFRADPNPLNQPSGIDIDPVKYPLPETEFLSTAVDSVGFTPVICPGDPIDFADVLNKFVVAPQHGYKSSGFNYPFLRGLPANRGKLDIELLQDSIGQYTESEVNLPYELINAESSRYKYGYQELPPDLGLSLKGSDPATLQRAQETFIYPLKRSGAFESGYYSGRQAGPAALDGEISALHD